MNNSIEIKKKIIEIAIDVLNWTEDNQFNEEEILYQIISNSNKAINFVVLIEDEFDIEFDDDEINMNFFSSLEYVVSLIEDQLK